MSLRDNGSASDGPYGVVSWSVYSIRKGSLKGIMQDWISSDFTR